MFWREAFQVHTTLVVSSLYSLFSAKKNSSPMMVSLLTLLLSLEVLLLLLESSRFPWDFGSRELKGNIYSLVLMHSLLEDWMTKQWRMTRECSVVCSAHVSYDTYHGFLWTILLAEWQFVCWLHWIVLLCVVSVLTILLLECLSCQSSTQVVILLRQKEQQIPASSFHSVCVFYCKRAVTQYTDWSFRWSKS